MSFKLLDDCNILQDEISAMKPMKLLRYHKIYVEDIVVVTDTRSAIKSISNVITISNLLHECQTSLSEMALHWNIALHWVRYMRNSIKHL